VQIGGNLRVFYEDLRRPRNAASRIRNSNPVVPQPDAVSAEAVVAREALETDDFATATGAETQETAASKRAQPLAFRFKDVASSRKKWTLLPAIARALPGGVGR
jgi:hypothetical protein